MCSQSHLQVLLEHVVRPIKNTMPPRKGKALMEKLKSRNMVEEDEDFPNDDEEYLSYHLGRLEGIPPTLVLQTFFTLSIQYTYHFHTWNIQAIHKWRNLTFQNLKRGWIYQGGECCMYQNPNEILNVFSFTLYVRGVLSLISNRNITTR